MKSWRVDSLAGLPGRSRFEDIETRWTLFGGSRPAALRHLAQTYGRATAGVIRGRLASGRLSPLRREEWSDLFQGFFVTLAETGWTDKLDRAEDSFRGYYLKRLRWYLSDQRRKVLRRGKSLPVDLTTEPETPDPLEEHFEKEWRRVMIQDALDRLRRMQPERYEVVMSAYLHPDMTDAERARMLGMTTHSYTCRKRRGLKALGFFGNAAES